MFEQNKNQLVQDRNQLIVNHVISGMKDNRMNKLSMEDFGYKVIAELDRLESSLNKLIPIKDNLDFPLVLVIQDFEMRYKALREATSEFDYINSDDEEKKEFYSDYLDNYLPLFLEICGVVHYIHEQQGGK